MSASDWQIWEGDTLLPAWPVEDRGLAYGDGLFETMRMHAGTVPWWPRHLARLRRGAQRLQLRLPEDATLTNRVSAFVAARDDGVCKLIIVRRGPARGYVPSPQAGVRFALNWAPLRPGGEAGLAVDVLQLRLAHQPMLAGIKHLNRLEQVLGSLEIQQRGLDDGLMLDGDGHVVCSTRANLFLRIDGRWLTPAITACGIAGVARGALLERLPDAGEAVLGLADVRRADAAFLCNAVRGVMPIRRIGNQLVATEACDLARRVMAEAHPAFAAPELAA